MQVVVSLIVPDAACRIQREYVKNLRKKSEKTAFVNCQRQPSGDDASGDGASGAAISTDDATARISGSAS